ncbi:hypothetical protein ASPBRDRAFT_44454 [Aspergillus brasiliensis CBS 101740]|uniref:Uncharacterized protein n=1 Tax=Aspergillus brasiliensis (strain CBS 101740 / IMI 381727 / IBT 21946) TaxID=767769 RepID=A0A1L9UF55_ASPBC|nr:hypothetical protein ASPBRDRAFT_44454 [Aspergillus brasiliensis CBS 101740]
MGNQSGVGSLMATFCFMVCYLLVNEYMMIMMIFGVGVWDWICESISTDTYPQF